MSSKNVEVLFFLLLLLWWAAYFCASITGGLQNYITEDKAVARFQELAGTTDVVVVRKSNDSWIIGNPFDVTYELRVNGKPMSGRCTSNSFSPMVCRLYSQGEGGLEL